MIISGSLPTKIKITLAKKPSIKKNNRVQHGI